MNFSMIENLLRIESIKSPHLFEENGVRQFSAKYELNNPGAWGKFEVPKDFSPQRYNEFLAGRYCIHKAMNLNSLVGISEKGTPNWPKGYCGSLTHSNGYVSVTIGKTENFKSIGRDSETIFNKKTAQSLEKLILNSKELKVNKMGYEEFLTLVYSAKESLFKALNPLTGTFFEFLDVEIFNYCAENRSFMLKLNKNLNKDYQTGTIFKGHFEFKLGFVHTALLVPLD
jgi:enterobactin synthetase component D